jgi:tetratricopeptide (TPR) repeat protein
MDSGKPTEALPELAAAVRLEPDIPQFHLSYGAALRLIPGREHDAFAAYEHALQINPCYADALCRAGMVLMQMPARNLDALEDFEKALQCQPNDAPARAMIQQMAQGQ